MKTHKKLVNEWMEDPEFKAEYDTLEEEFSLLKEILRARKSTKLTQADVAKRMGTKASAVARLESALRNKKHSPTIDTLRKYADAVDHRLKIKLVPK